MIDLLIIAEGDGDVQAVPILVRRIIEDVGIYNLNILKPTQKRGGLEKIKPNLERFLRMADKEGAPILWVVDCDDGVRDTELTQLRFEANKIHMKNPVAFCLMVKEYESLFLAEQNTARTCLNIKENTLFPANPENIRGAKEWLSKAMPSGSAYKETLDQAKITASIDLNLLREKSENFRLLEHTLFQLLGIQPT